MMTAAERVRSYAIAFPDRPPMQVVREQGRDVIYGIWVIGADYRNKTPFYGAYPKGYLERLHALFPDVPQTDVLHACSGSLPAGEYVRCDLKQSAEFVCDLTELPARTPMRFGLGVIDPPYSKEDAKRYETPMPSRAKLMRALAEMVRPGGHAAWLDTQWPIHSKSQWLTVGRIMVQRSTNHRVRVLSLFERVE